MTKLLCVGELEPCLVLDLYTRKWRVDIPVWTNAQWSQALFEACQIYRRRAQ